MKFNLSLDESLFDDEFSLEPDIEVTSTDIDDDFSEYEEHADNALPGPAEGADTGVSNLLIQLINDEWEAIQGYNDAIATLRDTSGENPFYQRAIEVLTEISSEENVHVGQLQEVLQNISPNAKKIKSGHEEAKNQLKFVNGVLPVQTWQNSSATQPQTDCSEEDICTLDNIDDEM